MKQIKKFFDELSIRFKIPLYLLTLIWIMLLMIWLVEVVFFDSIYQKMKSDAIMKTGDEIVSNIDKGNVDKLIEKASRDNDFCITVTDLAGNLIYSGDYYGSCKNDVKLNDFISRTNEALLTNQSIVKIKERNEPYISDISLINSKDFSFKQKLRVIKEISYTGIAEKGEFSYVVMLDTRLTPLQATARIITKLLFITTLVMGIIALIIGYFISRQIAKPILEISKQADCLAKGSYESKNQASGYLEIKQLSSSLNEAAEKLNQVEHLRNELIANVSHDLKTPLTMINGYAEMMRDFPDEDHQESLQIILDETKQLTLLVNDLLDLSRLKSGTLTLNQSQFDLNSLLHSVLDRIKALPSANGYIIEVLAEEKVLVKGDELKLSQVLYNLIINAINYTGSDKHVKIEQIIQNNKVRIEISDTGKGIAPEEINTIWERYYRTNTDHVRSVVGSGIGLSIVKQILELHQAKFGVHSKLEQGSTFWFELDLVDNH